MAASVTATFVFTDLVGSTELMSRVGEGAADDLRREHFALLRGAVEWHAGREVKNLGDGLMVVFDGVTGALSCAVAMQQAIAGRSSEREPLAIRIGVASGEAELDDGDYFGLPVVEAARLCAKAGGGEILATELVRMLARSRSDVELEPVGPLALKGLDEPVDTFRVLWVPASASDERAPLPARLMSALSATFVGRDDERDRLNTVWKAVEAGACRLMFVSGEPGIGKTTLAAEFAAQVREQGALVVYGRSDEDLGVPYQPWIETLGQLVAQLPEAVLAAHVRERGAHLARLIPQLSRRLRVDVPTGGDGDSERFVLYGCVTDLLARASASYPVLFVLDDLHWADRATVQLLRHVATADETMRIGVVGTFRDSDIDKDHPVSELLAVMHRLGGAERVALHGLDDLALLALLERVAGHDLDDDGIGLRDAILAETAGNPFFVVEILRHLVESRTIYQREGRWVSDTNIHAAGLPISVREVIGRRIANLGPETERVLILASVIGRDFDLPLLSAIADLHEDNVIDLCDRAAHASILQTTTDPDRYTFAHALIEHALYDGLSPARRARAHRNIAEHLESLLGDSPGERAGELAYHWGAAVQPADTSKAIRYAQIAGDRALQQLAPDEAVRWYTQAIELADRAARPDDHQRAELLVGLGDAQRQNGIAAYRETLLEAARLADTVHDVGLQVRAVLANNRGFQSAIGEGDYERIAAIDSALEAVGTTPTGERAQLLMLAATERIDLVDLSERLRLAEESVAIARSSGDRAALRWALQRSFIALNHPSMLATRTAWILEADEIVDQFDDPITQCWISQQAAIAAVERADGAALDEHWGRAHDIAARIPDTTIQWSDLYLNAWFKGLRGDLAEYERLAEGALTFGTENDEPDAFTMYAPQLTNVRDCQGRLHELIPLIAQASEGAPAFRSYRAGLAAAKARVGDFDEARQMVAQDFADGFPMPDQGGWSSGIAYWVDAAVRVGAVDAAPVLRELILPYHDQIVTSYITFLPALSHYLGRLDHLVGRYDDAEKWFTEAFELHQRVGSPILAAQTQAAWAALLADRNTRDDLARARQMAEEALATATTQGYGYIEADARAVLERLAEDTSAP